MKKYLILAFTIMVLISLASCGAEKQTAETTTAEQTTELTSVKESETSEITKAETETVKTEIAETIAITTQVQTTSKENKETTEKRTAKAAKKDYDSYGLAMEYYPESNTKGKIVFTQSTEYGNPDGELMTGSAYVIEKYENGKWTKLSTLDGQETIWTMQAYPISLDSEREFDVDYTNIYGPLDKGKYRISKEVNIYKTDGPRDDAVRYYAEFEI